MIEDLNIVELQKKAKERTVKTQNIEYDLETIVKRINQGKIKLDPEYQRNRRWTDETASRLIESLILNIPIPTIYLSQDVDADEEVDEEFIARFSVIDGQQRLTAIKRFIENKLALTEMDVLEELEGSYYENLPAFLKRRLEERTIKCLRIDSTLDPQVKYDIFERLNTGAVKLEPQELRNAIYRGKFNELIKELAKNHDFMLLNQIDIKDRDNNRKVKKMEDVELVLRFISFIDNRYKTYKPNLKTFLSDSMKTFNKEATEEKLEFYRDIFNQTMNVIRLNFGDSAFAKYKYLGKEDGTERLVYASKFNAAVYDALSISMADYIINNVDKSENVEIQQEIKNKYLLLFKDSNFVESISGSINDKTKLETRISTVKGVLRGEVSE